MKRAAVTWCNPIVFAAFVVFVFFSPTGIPPQLRIDGHGEEDGHHHQGRAASAPGGFVRPRSWLKLAVVSMMVMTMVIVRLLFVMGVSHPWMMLAVDGFRILLAIQSLDRCSTTVNSHDL